jgi:hypothetical protein
MKDIVMLLLMTTISYSQTISKQVIGTAGKTQSNSNIEVTWTIGEPIVGIMTAGGNQLGNGYHPALNLQALSIEDITLEVQIKLYPNPTSEFLYISSPMIDSFNIQIEDLSGKQVYMGNISKDQPLDVSSYSQGMYMVTIENKENNKRNTYKIIKN